MTPLGFEIRKIRSSRGMTLTEHANRIGISAAYLSTLENGYRGVPTQDTLNRIIEGLELRPDEAERVTALTRYSDPKVTVDTSGLAPLATEVANILAQEIRGMTEHQLSELLWLLRSCQPEQAAAK